MKKIRVAIIGNPNCGKSTIFNALTGLKQVVGNWPGVTVEKKVGNFQHNDTEIEIIDLPGVYSLNQSGSLDEEIAHNFLVNEEYDLAVNVIDSSNLARHLYLTTQLLEMQIPLILAFNMIDVAKNKGINIDSKKIEQALGAKVVKLIARKDVGVNDLKEEITGFPENTENKESFIEKIYPPKIYEQIKWIAKENLISERQVLQDLENRAEDNKAPVASHQIQAAQQEIIKEYDEESSIIIPGIRYEFINKIAGVAISREKITRSDFSNKLDKVFLNKFFGIPIFLLSVYLAFTFSIVVGGAFQDFFELFSEVVFMDIPRLLLEKISSPKLLTFLIADCIGGGIQTVLTFIPIIFGLYLFLSFLEDSGYLLRAAYLIDRAMKAIGLPGKAFFPLVVGFGCNVPAIMAARIVNNQNDRIAIAMIAPFMSCGARLSVYALFCAAFFPKSGQNIVFLLYIIGIMVGIFTGWLLKKTFLKSEPEHLMLELIDYHLPTLKGLMLKTLDKVHSFVFGAGKLIVIVFIVLQCLNSVSFDLTVGNQTNGKSMLAVIGKKITPVFKPIGIREENWPAAVGLFTGIFAKEVVVGTLNSLYLSIEGNSEIKPKPINIAEKLKNAFLSIPENISKITENLSTPLWLNLSDQNIIDEFLDAEGVSASIYRAMQKGFNGRIAVFSYLLFVLLYFPCVSVFGIIVREIGTKWAIISAVWSTLLAYVVSCSFYQFAVISHREDAKEIYMSIGLLILITVFILFVTNKKTEQKDANLGA
ncbi:Ferrous iron transport protein B [Candidatus Jidaibacter acanthamoeba]|uniref:Ferrous iron transport protein B n=1 Tax=Candidatus Jidaibacter acanthamoebae TaxID=86105 RepID=A0A0C1QNE3_9RICK|nr:Fe(2+) transporter permease subunit FeoB [Candidatus Jidaibacter acanthamoeba]KIE05548.1 Ferrous iron transport protein B [Candidatus Jidaibacter acanthamoeba]